MKLVEQRLGWTPGPTVTLKLVSPPFPLLPELFVLRSLPPSLIWPLRKTGPGLRLLLASGGSHGVWGLLILPPSACARRPLCDRKLTSYYPMIPSFPFPPLSSPSTPTFSLEESGRPLTSRSPLCSLPQSTILALSDLPEVGLRLP